MASGQMELEISNSCFLFSGMQEDCYDYPWNCWRALILREHSLLLMRMTKNIYWALHTYLILTTWYQLTHLDLMASLAVALSFFPNSCTGIFDLKMRKQKPNNSQLARLNQDSNPRSQAPMLSSCHQAVLALSSNFLFQFCCLQEAETFIVLGNGFLFAS